MTFKKKYITLSTAIAVLTLIYIMGSIFSPGNMQEKKSNEKIFDIAEIETVKSFSISTKEGIAELEKKNDKWIIKSDSSEYPASEYKISTFLDSLYNLNKNQIVGDDKKYWEKFDLTEDTAKFVTVRNSSNEALFTLFLGKSGPAEKGEYIRSTKSDEAYLTDASFKRYFYKDENYWSHLRILPEDIDSSNLTAMKITADVEIKGEKFKGSLDVVKEENNGNYEWYNTVDKEMYQRSKADTISNNITSLVADMYVEESVVNKDIVIQFETKKYGKQIIDIQKKNDDDFLLHIRGDNYTFQINQYKINRIISRLE